MSRETVKILRLKIESGWIYSVNQDGNVVRLKERYEVGKRAKAQIVSKTKVNIEDGFVYFVDKKGNISRAKLAKIKIEKKILKTKEIVIKKKLKKKKSE